jgi:hypothetical protein
MIETSHSFVATVYLAGDIDTAKRWLRRRCYERGLCVTIDPTAFIYTGGEESGMRIGLVNYPRFPTANEIVHAIAVELAEALVVECCQKTALVVSGLRAEWVHVTPPGTRIGDAMTTPLRTLCAGNGATSALAEHVERQQEEIDGLRKLVAALADDIRRLGEYTSRDAKSIAAHADRLARLEREHDRLVTVVEVQRCKLEQQSQQLVDLILWMNEQHNPLPMDITPADDRDALIAGLRKELAEAKKQQRLAWDRHAEKDRAYGEALRECDEALRTRDALRLLVVDMCRWVSLADDANADIVERLDAKERLRQVVEATKERP